MVTVSAPGKVILFGEHAVVYGKPSLVGAIDKRIYVDLAERSDDTISIKSDIPPNSISFSVDDISERDEFPYIRKALDLAFEHTGRKSGLDIHVSSQIPTASGLGSSAAVSIATIMAVHEAFGADISKEELAELGHKVEAGVQGAASPTDTAITTFGGVLFIEPEKGKYQRIDAAIPLVIGCTGLERSTKKLVDNVRALREKFPELIDLIISDIGRITHEAKRRIKNNEDVGGLMNINHGLLVSLGVSNQNLDALVYAARGAGANGAKLTGAGGGGCMIAHAPGIQPVVSNAIEKCGGMAFDSPISSTGVRVE